MPLGSSNNFPYRFIQLSIERINYSVGVMFCALLHEGRNPINLVKLNITRSPSAPKTMSTFFTFLHRGFSDGQNIPFVMVLLKGEVSPNNNVDRVRRKQF